MKALSYPDPVVGTLRIATFGDYIATWWHADFQLNTIDVHVELQPGQALEIDEQQLLNISLRVPGHAASGCVMKIASPIETLPDGRKSLRFQGNNVFLQSQ